MGDVAHDRSGVIDGLIDRLEAAWLPAGWERLDDDPRFYGWVPLPVGEFLDGMVHVRDAIVAETGGFDHPRFLDVGCGIGTKMVAADLLGFTPAGIELRPGLAAAARRLCPDATVEDADAFDFAGYADFDVVYSYRICKDLDEQHRLEQTVAGRMRSGALLFVAGSEPEGLTPVAEQVWRV